MQKRVSNHYFSFTRKERNGTVFLLFIILLLTAFPFIYPLFFKEKIINAATIQNELMVLETKQKDEPQKYYPKNSDNINDQNFYQPSENKLQHDRIKGAVFYFDPNTASTDDWKKLGLRDKTISTIQNFIIKGGRFRQPEDIKKIWGLHEDEVERLLPFIKIAETVSSPDPIKKEFVSDKYEQKKSPEMIDINLADTSALISLPGIGSKLANRIINFRDKLGGFYNIEQVAETFGLPDSVYQKIKPVLVLHDKNIRQVNINTASLDELKQHPYIRYNIANAIIQYRTQHGNFSMVSDLKKIMLVNEELYNKVSPYLTVQ